MMYCYTLQGKLFMDSADEKTIRIFDNYTSAKLLFNKLVGYINAELCEEFGEAFVDRPYAEMFADGKVEGVYWHCVCNGDQS